MSCRTLQRSSKTPTPACPGCSGSRSPRPCARSANSRNAFTPSSASWRRSRNPLCSSGGSTIPGVGLLTATALVAAVGDVQRFPSARHFASYLGLTPREHSTGQRRRLGAISKRGDTYLRMLLIHGARSVLYHAKTRTAPATDRLRTWALQLERLRGHNKAAVALANKLARIAWAVWRTGNDFTAAPAA